ncbi:MAG: EutN/CcmL family microcompartment protein [Clostridia bacterium]
MIALFIARVVGKVVATRKDEKLEGIKLLIIEPLKRDGTPCGKPLVAVDSVGAGAGEIVHAVKGREASLPLPRAGAPVDVAIVGIVDRVFPDAGEPRSCF